MAKIEPRTYTDEHGDLHVESDGVNDPTIVWSWRVQHAPGSPWAKKRGGWTMLRWKMTPDEAAAHAANPDNHVTAIEQVEGSEEVRMRLEGWGCPAGRGGTV
jgi:hypothetical protein